MTHLLEHLLLGLAQLLILDLPLAELPFQLLDVPAQCQLIPGEGRGRGRQGSEADKGVSPLGPSAQSPPVQSAPAEPTVEVLMSAFKALAPHTVTSTLVLLFILELYPSHNCGCPAYGVGR